MSVYRRVSHAVCRLLDRLAAGEAVQLLSSDTELTSREAAELLGISRTYLVRLIDEGRIPAHMVGTHRRHEALSRPVTPLGSKSSP